ncbi:PREDICTED: uncharacterized protein LOC105143682 [Acromyrmex echinatior]|uniref:uncharacterized protein LOC105143682 n=1 Tax=Acromyrmex echinatior TaxID=103372 RepID=UPI0005810AF1|nr:PREDICTED: uncharacterized protein LOC105143682 [Acromyrmex echinatior]XP_011050440.1 PREDICTED: uncharacterized protein LOC105143682 [Acromyrmex echinatior]XP_011050441.1 PREDICTED: uncharacterized protein LOC105143682 [Acromyrmex echinatior]
MDKPNSDIQYEPEKLQRFHESVANPLAYKEKVTMRILHQWAMVNAFLFKHFTFFASNTWVTRFKRRYNIKQRKITRFVSTRQYTSLEEIQEATKKFQIQTISCRILI